MTKSSANEKSLNARAYINSHISDMREKFSKVTDEKVRWQLIETFNELTSSDEYQGNLAIVQEDIGAVRQYARRKKWWDITPEEFNEAKAEFYGKDMDLNLWENFEKLSKGDQIRYIIDKFWYTQYSFDCLLKYKLTTVLDENDRKNFRNLNNKSAQTLLMRKGTLESEDVQRFFSHIDNFWTFNDKTLNLIVDNSTWFNYIHWKFSKKNTHYILKKLKEKGINENIGISLLCNYNKFTFSKWIDGLDFIVDYLYKNFASGILIKDLLDIRKEKKEGKTINYKLTPSNIKILWILKKAGANVFVSGSTIFKSSDMKKTISELKNLGGNINE